MEDNEYEEYYDEILEDDNNLNIEEDSDDESSSKITSSESSESSEEDDISDIDSNLFDTFEGENLNNKKKNTKQNQYIGCEYLTKFEKVRVLSVRAEQISCGAKIFVETNKTDPLEIALEELYSGKMPFIIRRYFGNKYIDVSVNSLLII